MNWSDSLGRFISWIATESSVGVNEITMCTGTIQ